MKTAQEIIYKLIEAYEELAGENACDCRHEPENQGHCCILCEAKAFLGSERKPLSCRVCGETAEPLSTSGEISSEKVPAQNKSKTVGDWIVAFSNNEYFVSKKLTVDLTGLSNMIGEIIQSTHAESAAEIEKRRQAHQMVLQVLERVQKERDEARAKLADQQAIEQRACNAVNELSSIKAQLAEAVQKINLTLY
jgi:ElaB/YqjD/DUF883 family membrane-anchored ribosome-binding protein